MEFSVFTIVELLFIGIIIYYQIKTGIQLSGRIKGFKYFIPNRDYFETEKVEVSKELLAEGGIYQIFEDIQVQHHDEEEDEYQISGLQSEIRIPITLINPRSISGTYFDQIIESLNIYLLKNNGGIADFSIVKDLVERNVSVEEEHIKDTINKPLYLGLMATIIGIIIGLGSMFMKANHAVSGASTQLDLQDFLISVCIAMIASLLGLLVTTVVGLNLFKDAKHKVELRKNDFYNFVQTDLLPVVSQDFGASVAKLTRTMHEFNLDFTSNVSSLSGLFKKNYDTLKVQDDILDRLQKINAQDFAKTNATVLSRLEKATGEFDRFNFFIESLNSRLTETRELSNSLNNLMNRVNNFEDIASKIDSRIEESNRIISLIDAQFSELEQMKSTYSMMVARVDDHLEDTLQEFAKHVVSKREGLVHLINEQQELLEKAYTENKTKFDKLDLLEKLDKLDVLFELRTLAEVRNEHIEQGAIRLGRLEDNQGTSDEKIHSLLGIVESVKSSVEVSRNNNSNMDSKLNQISSSVKNIESEVNRGFLGRIFGKK